MRGLADAEDKLAGQTSMFSPSSGLDASIADSDAWTDVEDGREGGGIGADDSGGGGDTLCGVAV